MPPHLHFEPLNPHITIDGTRFAIPTELSLALPAGSAPRRRQRVRLVRHQRPPDPRGGAARADARAPVEPVEPVEDARPPCCRSRAASPDALRARAEAVRSLLGRPEGALRCRTSATRPRSAGATSGTAYSLVARSREDALAALSAYLDDKPHPGLVSGRKAPERSRRLVFLFSGQGSQWLGMGRELLARRRRLPRDDGAVRGAPCESMSRGP